MLPKSYQTFEPNVSEERVPLFAEYSPNNRRPSTAPQVSSTSTNLSQGSLQISPALPLSWPEARHRLRIVLQQFLDTPSSSSCISKPLPLVGVAVETENVHNSFRGGIDFFLRSLWNGYFDQNWDTVTTFISSLFFLFFSISLWYRHDGQQPEAHYVSFCFSTFLFFMIVVFTCWIHWKRKFSKYMEEPHIRHIVSHYLKNLHWEERDPNKSSSHDTSLKDDDDIMDEDIPATHLNDIYNVFRLSSPPTTFSSTNTNPTQIQPCGNWLRVPSLLLVKGDYISLQAGDTVPGNCFPLSSTTTTDPIPPSSSLVYGAKVPPIPNVLSKETPMNPNSNNPPTTTRGNACWNPYFLPKETLLADSTKLLHLCNNMRIFILDETPMERFLNNHSPVQRRIPQMHRQALALRRLLHLVSVLSFGWTLAVHGMFSLPIHDSLLFLSSIGTLSTGMFICNFLIEIMGTSRILMGIHLLVRPSSNHNHNHHHRGGGVDPPIQIFSRYLIQVILSRMGMHVRRQEDLIHVPPAASYLFEKLGVVTTLTFVDDELVCSPVSNPHQLLLPTDRGLKLLNLYSKTEEQDTLSMDQEDTDVFSVSASSDSGDSDLEESRHPRLENNLQRSRIAAATRKASMSTVSSEEKKVDLVRNHLDEVQFEDPEYWHYLPSLKCIGLCCLLVDSERDYRDPLYETKGWKRSHEDQMYDSLISASMSTKSSGLLGKLHHRDMIPKLAEQMLVRYIRKSPSRFQLSSLARCIGFQTEPTLSGNRGDITPFIERGRFHVIATRLLTRRMTTDLHAVGLEESRHWGYLRSDTESVVVKDMRTNKYQLLTVGDARTVTDLCSDSWQGENCSLIPLSQSDRQAILDVSKTWALADLDVCAFSYAPVPFYLDSQVDSLEDSNKRWNYLVDNRVNADTPISISKDVNDKWSVMKNQIFLGLLGSTVSPRREAVTFLDVCNRAGVRFVYFSPRNMRRTKELASQMGIDVAWNCAISLRPLHEGEEADRHRMISSYADWDVNARLPHGVSQVKKHLVDVDNVPLLVHLFTDVTRQTTAEMLGVFKEYHETVLVLGLSHVHGNNETFLTADLAIGINNIASSKMSDPQNYPLNQLTHEDISFVCAVVSHSCVFKLSGDHFLTCMPKILSRGRAALDAGISSVLFSFTSYISFSMLTAFCSVTISTAGPCPPGFGGVLVLFVLIPLLSISLCFTSPDKQCMDRVPPKNDSNVTFASGERLRLFIGSLGKALLPAIASHILYLWSFAQIVLKTDAQFLSDHCGINMLGASPIILIRCNALKFYSGPAKVLAECIMLLEFALCLTIYSSSFLYRTAIATSVNPWRINHVWSLTVIFSIGLILLLGSFAFPFMPWSIFVVAMILPILSLVICEVIKRKEMWYLKRSDTFRRLQFETKLGMWSPKA